MKPSVKISALLIVVSTLLSFYLYSNARNTAVLLRGNSSFGGEVLLFLLPLIVYVAYRNYCDNKATRGTKEKQGSVNRNWGVQV